MRSFATIIIAAIALGLVACGAETTSGKSEWKVSGAPPAGGGIERATQTAQARPTLAPTSTPQPQPLFVDASNGIEEFVPGRTMPFGEYDFKCGEDGSVTFTRMMEPHTVSMRMGDHTRAVKSGHMVTVSFCKVYGPR